MTFRDEAAIAAAARAWFETHCYEVKEEVVVPGCSGRADLVASRSNRAIVVECKRRLSWDLLRQALAWEPRKREVWVAVPRVPAASADTLAALNLGWIELRDDGASFMGAPNAPRLDHDPVLAKAAAACRSIGRAGAAGGAYDTAKKRALAAVSAYVSRHPTGVQWRDLFREVDVTEAWRTKPDAKRAIRQAARHGTIGVTFTDRPITTLWPLSDGAGAEGET